MASSTDRARTLIILPQGAGDFVKRRVEEVVGLAMLILGAGLVLALLSYTSTDPSPLLAAPGPVHNLLGVFGSYVTDVGLKTLGTSHLLLIAIILAWGWRLFGHKSITHIWLRLTLLPLALLAGSIACGAAAKGMGGVIGRLALDQFAALGPFLGHLSSGTVGVAMAAICVATTIWVLGFSPGEWRSFGLGTLAAGLSAARATRRAASAAQDMAKRGMKREPGFAGPPARPATAPQPQASQPHAPQQSTAPFSAGEPVARTSEPPSRQYATDVRVEPIVDRAPMPPVQDDHDHGGDLADIDDGELPGFVDLPTTPQPPRMAEPVPPPPAPKRPAPAPTASQRSLDLVQPGQYQLPPADLLALPPPNRGPVIDEEQLQQNARQLEAVLQDFGVRGEIVKVRPGPVVTLYELEPAPGTKSSRVIGLADDIARSMSAIAVRIAVVPGRSVIGIELPNAKRETVYMREILTDKAYEESQSKLALILGKDIGGAPIVVDLARMPHLLIAGTTGSGKSVGINTMILSILYRMPPDQCRFIMIDPKMLELSVYDGIPHLLAPVVTDPKKAVVALKWAVREMETRYRAMSKLGVRNIEAYNTKVAEITHNGEQTTRQIQVGFDEHTGEPLFEEQALDLTHFPYIVVVVDEMADLMLVAGKDIEGAIQRLAQMARAAGIHIIMATQRPSVDVITGTIKANFPTRISFQVTSKIDSRTILGEAGAEQLLGQGDMLYMAGGGRITRVHGPFVSDSEVEHIVKFLKDQGEPTYIDAITEDEGEADGEGGGYGAAGGGEGDGSGDDLYDQALALVARERKASTSFIQRHLQIGYNRAARLIDRMEAEGVVGAANHVGKREVLLPRGGGSEY
jgi:S-DNA-T family DNA segregation ATPase FtsK/SpoIIIE